MAAGPVGPASIVSLQPVEAVSRTSGRARPPAQGGEESSTMAIQALSPNDWAVCMGVGVTTAGT